MQTVITTHFREVFDLDLLMPDEPTDANTNASHNGRAATGAGARVSTGRPPGTSAGTAAPTDVAFYQMEVLLDKRKVHIL